MSLSVDGRVARANAQRESRRADILDVALAVFARKGYHQTRVSDIIGAAGIARGTFYLYFESKSAIFLELLDRLLEELRGSVVGVDPSEHGPAVEEQLQTTVKRILKTVINNRRLAKIITREAVGLDEEVDEKLREFYGSLLTYLRSSLEVGMHLGFVRDLDVQTTALCILGSVKQLMEHHVLIEDPTEADIDAMSKTILEFNLRGVMSSQAGN